MSLTTPAAVLTAAQDGGDVRIHVVMFPWLAMGHLIPFFHLSTRLAQLGHRVSFVSTPRNLRRLPKPPAALSPLISLVSLPLPQIHNLPPDAESSLDIPPHKSQLLKQAFDLLQTRLIAFLRTAAADWILCDYASHWLPPLAAELGVSSAFFSLFTAACLAYIGPPSRRDSRSTAEDFAAVPDWVPLESNLAFRPHEVKKITESAGENESGTSDTVRYTVTVRDCDFVAIRSSPEFEPEWFELLAQLYQKPVVPVGFLPPVERDEDDERWVEIKEWLDRQRPDSVVYVALGSEATLSGEQITELALGLEQSRLPFLWVIRKPNESTRDCSALPEGFEERVEGRGMVYVGWAPQVRILSHWSVGGFLTHCGWNSVIEGLGLGRVLVLLPVMNDQGLNARLLEGKRLGVEVDREERDGWFSRDSVADSVRLAMVEEEGEAVRVSAREMRGVFGDADKNDRHVGSFVRYLVDNRGSRLRREG
ncbi:UDP-glycosyltransferase 91C1-like [Malania oleifera]|uniref:UDP-glycosyltransferase 91C1-like n=1 Tax=Malania oleifera TaxID=397392 RepID=UPI0025AEC325|nr:UDP-glycosyltransferase 91C1-like [Malania oleifera]